MSDNNWPIPKTVNEALEFWDKDTPVLTLEMGGIGPSHEQCIHIGVFEVIRHFLKNPPLPTIAREAYDKIEEILPKIDKDHNLQLTNNQAAAIQSLVFHFMVYGYGNTVRTYNNKRHIMVGRLFPAPQIIKPK